MSFYPPSVDVHRNDPVFDDWWITEYDAADQTEEEGEDSEDDD